MQSKREEEKNRDMEPPLRVIYKFHRSFDPSFQEGHACPKSMYGRDILICFHSKGDCVHE